MIYIFEDEFKQKSVYDKGSGRESETIFMIII
jgi:hypothetical protein